MSRDKNYENIIETQNEAYFYSNLFQCIRFVSSKKGFAIEDSESNQ